MSEEGPSSPWKLRDHCSSKRKAPETANKKGKKKKTFVSLESSPPMAALVPKKPPSYKSVVQLLSKPLREEERTITSRSGVQNKRTYLVYKCPNEYCKEKNREIWFQKSVGFINPFNHLKSCIADGKAEQLYMVYKQNRESKRLHVSGTFFQPTVERMTAKALALNDYLRLIVLKNLPLSTIEDPEFRKFHRYNEKISRKVQRIQCSNWWMWWTKNLVTK